MLLGHPFKFIKHDKGKEKCQIKKSEQIMRKQMVLQRQKNTGSFQQKSYQAL